MATNNKKKNQNPYTPVYVLSAIAAILIVAIIVLIAVNSCSEPNNVSTTETVTDNMTKKIKDLNIKENPVATLTMENGGVMLIELYPEIAPNTVCNFIELANSGYYDGLIFHRCIPGFMIQGGDPEGTGMGGPGFTIKGEFTSNGFKNDLKHERGVISMARQGENPYTGEKNYDSAGSQFFIMVEDYPSLNEQYASFGKVISGMEVADAIVANETDGNDKPLVEQVIKSIRVDTKGIEYPKAEKIQ
ncbi:MAG: peptidylprolyl isomerase [Clostridia bacterium]|nr:peptidylprolyl isomerase [Clostridia bacterium]